MLREQPDVAQYDSPKHNTESGDGLTGFKIHEKKAIRQSPKMALILNYSPSSALPNFGTSSSSSSLWLKRSINRSRSVAFGNYSYKTKKGVKAFFFNPTDEPILKEALKEPVAFMGGMFAGLLRLDLNEDPLKEWVTRTVEASGITEEEIDAEGSKPEEEIPQQIEIE